MRHTVKRLPGMGYTFAAESSIFDPAGTEICVIDDRDDTGTADFVAAALSARAGCPESAARVLAEIAVRCRSDLHATREEVPCRPIGS